MGWIPSKKCIGGIYDGRDFLTGNLNSWLDYAGVIHAGNDYFYAHAQDWEGKASVSGTIGDAYIDYKIQNTAVAEALLCEFKVKANPNKQFNKHTLRIYFNSGFNYRDYRGQQFYEISDIEFRFARRVYYNDGTTSETSLGSVNTSWVIFARFILNWMTAWDGGFTSPSQMIFATGKLTYNDVEYYCIAMNVNADNTRQIFMNRIVGLPVSQLATAFDVEEFEEVVIDDPNYDDDDDKSGDWFGGDGDHDDHSDDIDEPDILSIGASSVGFLSLYSASASLMQQFASSLWDLNFVAEVTKFFTKPLDWIVGVKMMPIVPVATRAAYPKWGSWTWPVPLSEIDDQYFELDCGSVSIAEYWGNCFDYDPYTTIEIWLPYIGYRQLPVDQIMCHEIHCRYEIDLLTGCCCAIISTDALEDGIPGSNATKVVGQYYGNCGVDIPVSAESRDGMVAAMMQAAGTFLNKAIPAFAQQALQPPEEYSDYEAAVNVGSGYISAMGTTVKNISAMKSQPGISGNAGNACGMMSVQTPFLIINRPHQDRPDAFRQLHGYMSNFSGKLGDFSGYAQVEDIQLNNIPAFEPELKEIIQLLKGGVII